MRTAEENVAKIIINIYLFYSFLRCRTFALVCATSEEVTCSQKAHRDANFAHGATFKLH